MFDDFETDLLDEEPAAASESLIEGLLPPRQMSECLSHEDVETALLELIDSSRMPHALIFAGPQGIGKATLSFRLARYLLKNGSQDSADGGLFGDTLPQEKAENLFVAPDDPVFRRVASGGHPDLFTAERPFDDAKGRAKGSVDVDTVRKINPFMRMTASQGGWRIVIVDDADTMNRNAQNAILKMLEEPPARTLLILVAHRPGALIPTIRSRCRVISFQPLSHDVFHTLIRRNHGGLPQDDLDVLYNIARGSVGRGLQIAEEGGLEIVGKLVHLLYGWPDWPWSQIHMLADTMGRPGQEDSLRAFQDVLLWIVETLLRAKARGEAPPAPLNNEATEKLLAHYSLEDWIAIAANLRSHFDTVAHANLDKRHAVLGAFSVFKKDAA